MSRSRPAPQTLPRPDNGRPCTYGIQRRVHGMMRLFVLLLITAVCATGCVGVSFSRNGDVVSNADISPVDLRYRSHPPNKAPERENPDGSKTYVLQDETKWCGLTVFAIIPVPLMLPLCQARTEVTYRNGQPTFVEHQWPKSSGAICSLFPLFGNHAAGLCAW